MSQCEESRLKDAEWDDEEDYTSRTSMTTEDLIANLKERNTNSTEADEEKDQLLDAQFFPIILPIFFYFFTLFSILPLTYQVIIDQTCISLDADDCSNSEVSSKASLTVLYANTATYLPGLLSTGFYSSVANVYGRKVVMIISLFGLMIYAFLFAYVVFNEPSVYMEIIILASFVMGTTGTYATFMMGAFSYVADTTTATSRTRAYSITESFLYIGKIVGPLASGFWAHSFGFRVPFVAAAIAAGLCIFYIIFFVKESLFLMKLRQASTLSLAAGEGAGSEQQHGDEQDPQCSAAAAAATGADSSRLIPTSEPTLVFNPMQTYYNLKILFSHTVRFGQSPVPFIAIAFFLFHFSLMGFMQVVYVYMKYEYEWNSLLIGLYDSISGAIQVQTWKIILLPVLECQVYHVIFIIFEFSCLCVRDLYVFFANAVPIGRVYAFCSSTGARTASTRTGNEHMDNDGVYITVRKMNRAV